MNNQALSLYLEKEKGYFQAARLDLLEMLPSRNDLHILEVGAGEGATLKAAKERRLATYTVGIELVAPELESENPIGVDVFLAGDFEAMDLQVFENSFDVVICGDVLEHLRDPWTSVRRLTKLLKPNGLLLSSIPNFRNHRVLSSIVFQGDFRYADAGLLDRTHLRFFCRTNARDLFEQAGLVVETIETNMGAYGLRHRLLDFLTLGYLHDFFVFQFRICARKSEMEEDF
jgi:2-polyprenyl-3-methyl-5-hydroxy-6-metoxy-1,4-benzoquinol methylase